MQTAGAYLVGSRIVTTVRHRARDRYAEAPLFEDGRNEPPAPAGEDILG